MPAEPEIVNVLGEQVSLKPTQLSPAEKYLVSFDEKYRSPEMSDSEALVVKKLFLSMFSAASVFLPGKSNPLPPCTDKEKALLLKSLRYRFSLLRNELLAERQSQTDSLRLRQILDHVQRLKEYLDFAESVKDCKDLDEDILGESLGELSDEQTLELLRQFVFFLLQGQHPLQDFVGHDPNPKGFVARLTQKPIPNFKAFLDKYKEQKYPISRPIQEVLQATQLDLGAMKKGLEDAMQEKTKEILALVRAAISPEEEQFWKEINPNDLTGIVDKVLQLMQDMRLSLEDCDKEIERLTQSTRGIRDVTDSAEQEKKALEAKIRLLEEDKRRLETEGRLSPADLEKVKQELQGRIDGLQSEKQALQSTSETLTKDLKEKEARIQELLSQSSQREEDLKRLQESQTQIEELKQAKSSLEEQLEAAVTKVKACEQLQAQIQTLEAQAAAREKDIAAWRESAGKLTVDIHTARQEKDALQEQLSKLEEEADILRSLQEQGKTLQEQSAQTVLPILEDIQRKRKDMNKQDDPVLSKLLEIQQLVKSKANDPSLPTHLGELAALLQEEMTALEAKKSDLERQIQTKEAEIQSAIQAMEESNQILTLVRKGKADLQEKGYSFETDTQALEAAFKAVEAEKALAETKKELEETAATLRAQNQSLMADMEALTARFTRELQDVRQELTTTSEELRHEKESGTSLRGDLAARDMTIVALEKDIADEKAALESAKAAFEEERKQAAQQMKELEETKIRECEEQLQRLRAEEDEKRKAMAAAQGSETGSLQAQLADLLQKVSTVEGERNSAQEERDRLQERITKAETALTTLQEESDTKLAELEAQLSDAKDQTASVSEELRHEKETVASLRGDVFARDETIEALQASLEVEQGKAIAAVAAAEKEKEDATRRISEIEQSTLRDYEAKLDTLRKEEEKKRQALLDAQGGEKGTLEAKLAELQQQTKSIEALRDSAAMERDSFKQKLAQSESNVSLAQMKLDAVTKELTEARTMMKEMGTEMTKLLGHVTTQTQEVEELKQQIISDTTEREKLFELISAIAAWIASGGKTEAPRFDPKLNTKYGLNRIVDAFLSSLPAEDGDETCDPIAISMSRCQLVFFMSYIYARHFPKVRDANASYQSVIVEFLTSIQTDIYRELDVPIPGKLEPVGSGGIPLQLKSKYLMNLILPLLKQMELVHESGKRGAEFLKFSTITEDQVSTLDKLNKKIIDKLLNPKFKGMQRTLNDYVIKRTGNVDDDIQDLFLRFYRDDTIQRVFPVIMYVKMNKDYTKYDSSLPIPKITFGSETEFSQFVSTPAKPVDPKAKTVASDSDLVSKPVLSFNLMFYLFLFFVKDYLSSIQGELDKAGCPLPQILKPL